MNKKLYKLMNWPEIEAIVYAEDTNPYNILGPKQVGASALYQAYFPNAQKVDLITILGSKETVHSMELADESGFFACLVTGKVSSKYEYEVTTDKATFRIKDAYAFKDFELDDKDIAKFMSGIHYTLYDFLGAHPSKVNGCDGVCFRVWAPNAVSCCILGSFNSFESKIHLMKKNEDAGIFEIFIPDAKVGDKYLYEIKQRGGECVRKLDPFSQSVSMNEDIVSIVSLSKYDFKDSEFIKSRSEYTVSDSMISIYELNLGYFIKDRNGEVLNYKELGKEIAAYVKEMGYTHVNLMPIMEYIEDSTWGYQTLCFYAPTNRYGGVDDLKEMIDTLHGEGIGVILDWAPYHFAKGKMGLSNFDGTCLYEHLDSKKGVHPFYGTGMFNLGRKEISNFLIANALYWVEQFHIDGIRVDGVSSILYLDYGRREGEWIPNMYGGNENLDGIEFIKHLNSIMKKRNPGIVMIAQDDSYFPMVTGSLDHDGLGFDLKLNKGLTDDLMDYISYDPYFRSHHHSDLTDNMLYQYSENFITSLGHEYFTYGQGSLMDKMPGELPQKVSGIKMTLAYCFMHPGKKLIFAGQDLGVTDDFDENATVDWSVTKNAQNKGIKALVRELNKLGKKYPALYELDNSSEGFEWINCISNEQNMISFLRKTHKSEDAVLVVCNFADMIQTFSVGTPFAGKYKLLLSTDQKEFAGNNIIGTKVKTVSENEADGKPFSIEVKMAPLSVAIYKYIPFTEKEQYQIDKRKEAAIAKTKAGDYQEEADRATVDYELAQKQMEEAKARMNEAKKRIDEALEKKNKELEKAKKALEEAE